MKMEYHTHNQNVMLRLQRITDVIFAMSMVLFIITGTMQFSTPGSWNGYDQNPTQYIYNQIYELVISFLVFLFMALYWYTNTRLSKFIVKVDGVFIWLQIFFLFFIAMAPLPNALSIKYSDDQVVQMFFNITMLCIGSLAFFSWVYASGNHRLTEKTMSSRHVNSINREMAIEPLVAVMAIMATLIDVRFWTPVLLLLPLLTILNGILGRRKSDIQSDAGLPAA